MKLGRILCASQGAVISVDLLGLHSAQNFISRLPHGVQTRYKADKWKSLRYRHPHYQAHRTTNHHNTSLSPGDTRLCALAEREPGCSQDPDPPCPCYRCPQTWTPRRVNPATVHRDPKPQIYRHPPHLGVRGGLRRKAIFRRPSSTLETCASTFRGPLLSTRSSQGLRKAKIMSTIPRTFGCQTTRQS
jgi:hypothetical protein